MKGLTCSFCGRKEDEVPIIPGAKGNICFDCVKRANDIVSEFDKSPKKAAAPLPPTPSAKEIKAFLDEHVIGHDETKKVLSVAVHNHYRRLEAAQAKSAKGKGKKVVVYHYKRKSGYHKKNGHRQPYTKLQIEKIEG